MGTLLYTGTYTPSLDEFGLTFKQLYGVAREIFGFEVMKMYEYYFILSNIS